MGGISSFPLNSILNLLSIASSVTLSSNNSEGWWLLVTTILFGLMVVPPPFVSAVKGQWSAQIFKCVAKTNLSLPKSSSKTVSYPPQSHHHLFRGLLQILDHLVRAPELLPEPEGPHIQQLSSLSRATGSLVIDLNKSIACLTLGNYYSGISPSLTAYAAPFSISILFLAFVSPNRFFAAGGTPN